MKRTVMATIFVAMLVGLVMIYVATASDLYVHPEVLASTEWLNANLDNPLVRVIATADCRQPTHKDTYTAGHVPGAIYMNVFSELSDPESAIPMMRISHGGFEELMGRLGIFPRPVISIQQHR